MDAKSISVVDETTAKQKYYLLTKTAFQFLVSFSLFSFLISYFSGFLSYNILDFSTLFFPLSALNRNYMFLICNGILAFLAKNMRDYTALVTNSTDEIVEEATLEEKVESIEHKSTPQIHVPIHQVIQLEEEQDDQVFCEGASEELEIQGSVLIESEDSDEDEEDVDDQTNNASLVVEEISDAIVSTEELNNKCEEFIRKMKEEIRIEA